MLRGFSKDFLQPGESCTVTFELNRKDLSDFNNERDTWVLKPGDYEVYVGKSVLDIQLTGSIRI